MIGWIVAIFLYIAGLIGFFAEGKDLKLCLIWPVFAVVYGLREIKKSIIQKLSRKKFVCCECKRKFHEEFTMRKNGNPICPKCFLDR